MNYFIVILLALGLYTPVNSDAATKESVAPVAVQTNNTKTRLSVLPLLGGNPPSPGASAQRSTLAPALNAVVAPAPTNRPLVIAFDATPAGWFTNEPGITINTITNAGFVWDIVSTPRFAWPQFTNYLLTVTTGSDFNAAFTNRSGVITNRGPVTVSVLPTNKYVITLWGLPSDGQLRYLGQRPFPAAPVNVATFTLLPIFSSDLTKPRDLWQRGTQTLSFSVTNAMNFGTNQFVNAEVRVTRDDFTPKAVSFGGSYQLFPTNQP